MDMIKFGKILGVDDMEQDIVDSSESVTEQLERSPEVIAREINFLLLRTRDNFIEIGNLLLEAREQVKHGEWEVWLKENVSFSRYTAHKFMQVSLRFSNVASTQHFNTVQIFKFYMLKSCETLSAVEIFSIN